MLTLALVKLSLKIILTYSLNVHWDVRHLHTNVVYFIDIIDRKPLFGQSLQEHLESENREIAYVIEECIGSLSEAALREEVNNDSYFV